MCRINNSYGHTSWMMGIRALDKLAGKTEADKYHLLCGRCAALPMGLWNRSVSLFLPHHSKLKCLSSSLCALLSLSLSLPLSLTLSQCPISAVNSHQGCPGLLGKTLNRADRRRRWRGQQRRTVPEWWEQREKAAELDGSWIVLCRWRNVNINTLYSTAYTISIDKDTGLVFSWKFCTWMYFPSNFFCQVTSILFLYLAIFPHNALRKCYSGSSKFSQRALPLYTYII